MESQEILKAVNDFYQQAWDKLLIYSGILVGVVGIIIPILFNWLQNRTISIREEAIKKGLENNFNSKVREIEEKLIVLVDEKLEKKSNEIQKTLRDHLSAVEAGVLLVQGISNVRIGNLKDALSDFCGAGKLALESNDIANLQRINNNLNMLIPTMSKEDLVSIQEEESQPTEYFSLLEKNNSKSQYSDLLMALKREVSKKLKSED